MRNKEIIIAYELKLDKSNSFVSIDIHWKYVEYACQVIHSNNDLVVCSKNLGQTQLDHCTVTVFLVNEFYEASVSF